jgi:polar amino acid transport system substrate-binding protein
MSITDERKEVFDFSVAYYRSKISIGVPSNNTSIKSFEDLRGKKVAVKLGTTSETWLNKHKDQYGITDVKKFDTGDLCYSSLKVGAVDAFMDNQPVLEYAVNKVRCRYETRI